MSASSVLQHPRRNLGNRHRAQANRFVKLSKKDPNRAAENLAWAEQNAQQAVLYDFTDERNWRCLAEIKKIRGDSDGMFMVLEDLFVVLGRNPEFLTQLNEIDHLEFGLELLEAAFEADSLDPEKWFSGLGDDKLEEFSTRCTILDFTDQRANIIFGRRLERLRIAGHESLFIELVQYLLAHRPANHELWMELGRLYERRNDNDHAWLCYDHVQQLRPTERVRDLFLERLKGAMDGEDSVPWSGPELKTRQDFLMRMKNLTQTVSASALDEEVPKDSESENKDLLKLESLLESGDAAEAFFFARSLLTSGELWAEDWMEKAKSML